MLKFRPLLHSITGSILRQRTSRLLTLAISAPLLLAPLPPSESHAAATPAKVSDSGPEGMLMQVFELSESQVCRNLAELDQPPNTPTEETLPCPLS